MELQDHLVSLIVPFYNAQDYLDRFLDSVLAQTYSSIQLILVNDGSTDAGDAIVNRRRPELEGKLSSFLYVTQENGGAASAVNTALKYVAGEFLCWADSDDLLLPDNVKQKYEFLVNHPDYGMVMCGAQAFDYETDVKRKDLVLPSEKRVPNMFQSLVDGVPCYSGVFMVRTALLFEKLENREIYYDPEAGQNYQLLLPVAYFHKCGFIDPILYTCYIRRNSHSRNVTMEKAYHRTFVRELLLKNIVTFMPDDEYKAFLEQVHIGCEQERFQYSFAMGDRKKNAEAYQELKKAGVLTKEMRRQNFILNKNILYAIYQFLSKFKK